MAIGLDIGTGNLVAARQVGDKTNYNHERNSFIYIGNWNEVKNRIKRTNISYTRLGEKVYILGSAAYDYANIFGEVELRRPMALGMLNPSEKDALPIMKELLGSLLGKPEVENEICAYVTPSEPIDTSAHTVYHEDVTKAIVESLGYKAINIKEAIALAYAGLVEEDLTGISVSFGAGMCNIAVMFKGIPALDFSITKSGDYIDENAARESGKPVAQITSIKEEETFTLDPSNPPTTREKIALVSYYRFVVKNTLSQIAHLFTTSKGMPQFKEPILIACGGGTAMIDGFIELFKEEYEKLEFPIKIKDIKLVSNPLFSVANGALSEALLEEEV